MSKVKIHGILVTFHLTLPNAIHLGPLEVVALRRHFRNVRVFKMPSNIFVVHPKLDRWPMPVT